MGDVYDAPPAKGPPAKGPPAGAPATDGGHLSESAERPGGILAETAARHTLQPTAELYGSWAALSDAARWAAFAVDGGPRDPQPPHAPGGPRGAPLRAPLREVGFISAEGFDEYLRSWRTAGAAAGDAPPAGTNSSTEGPGGICWGGLAGSQLGLPRLHGRPRPGP